MMSMTAMGAAQPVLSKPRDDDRYPSRFGTQGQMKDRLDPVVWGTPEQGSLSNSQLLFCEDNGYLNFDQLLAPDEVQACLAELQRLRGDEALKKTDEAVVEPGSRELRSLFAVHRSSEVLKALCEHPKLVAIARQLLGSDVYIHQSRINYKGGFRGKEFYWHSDFETWHVEDGVPAMRLLSCSIALTANTPYNEFAHKVLTAEGSNKDNAAASYFKILRTPQDTMPRNSGSAGDTLGQLTREGGLTESATENIPPRLRPG